ncbi:hypothetical protein PVAND_014336 [Polypedilum vanderplanki]|uniref:Endonuclease/exonuclease/phosphatase domain-containing protein n=1 Tax=Polypedilum vanderplanki TaxID=319348 RepID=A0A9J6CT83_POLVA|nr:hypothetical protein PVAND_014336 [Polypedilum vanderplanki]
MGVENITFDQINLHHCKEAASHLCCRLNSGASHISLIQEPYVFRGKVSGLGTSGTLHYVMSSELQARACVYTSSRINAVMLRQFSSRDFVAVRIRLGKNNQIQDIVVCSAYLPYEDMVPAPELRATTEYCINNGLQLVLGCDANSHHIIWGSSDTNTRGTKLMEFICELGLVILNRGNRPTFVNRLREEVIDLTLCSPGIEDLISGWHVSDEDSLSDHQTIRFRLKCEPNPEAQYRNIRRTNFQSYLARLRWRIGSWDPTINNSVDLEAAVTMLTESVVLSFQESCPLRRSATKKKTAWYNSKLADLKKACNYAWNHRAKDGMEAVRVARNAYRRECRKSRREVWQAFCESVEGISPTARLHKILSKDRHIQVDTLRLSSGEYVSEDSEVLKHLLSTHFPECVSISDIPPIHSGSSSIAESWRKSRPIASRNNIRRAIQSFHPYKSASMDGIFPALLQVDVLVNPLHEIFTASLALGYIPKLWQQVKVNLFQSLGVYRMMKLRVIDQLVYLLFF